VEIFPAGCFFKKQDFLPVALLLSPALRSPTRFVGRSPPLSLCVPEAKRSGVSGAKSHSVYGAQSPTEGRGSEVKGLARNDKREKVRSNGALNPRMNAPLLIPGEHLA
jgi:hypothetical protein